jgi:REP element-mobilizing transposase RayT
MFHPGEVSVFHCVQRAVRRAMLCGRDPLSGKDYEHRREWIRDRLEFQAACFGIDVLSFSVMHNHLHVILRNRPDVVETWSDEEVAARWWKLFPKRRDEHGNPAKPEPHELRMLIATKKQTVELRRRLSDLSWFMRCLALPVAVRANREDQCTGRFWEGRFKSQKLSDEAALLACSVYVDLNPVRAAVVATPEDSDFTSVQERIEEAQGKTSAFRSRKGKVGRRRIQRLRRPAEWLSPIELKERGRPGPCASVATRRASDKGFLPMSLQLYLQLVDWTGRQVRGDKRGAIPAGLRPILDRIGLNEDVFVRWVAGFKKLFKRVVGTPASLWDEAQRTGARCLHAPGARLVGG